MIYADRCLLWANDGVSSILCVNLTEEESGLDRGRFRAFTPDSHQHVVPVKRSRSHVTDALDWIDEFEAGPWSLHTRGPVAEFSFDDHVTAVQFKLTLMDNAR